MPWLTERRLRYLFSRSDHEECIACGQACEEYAVHTRDGGHNGARLCEKHAADLALDPAVVEVVREPRKPVSGWEGWPLRQAPASAQPAPGQAASVQLPLIPTEWCAACGQYPPAVRLERHHIKSRALGGTDEPGNLMVLCVECHSWIHGRDWGRARRMKGSAQQG